MKTDVGGGTETLPKNGEEVACEREGRDGDRSGRRQVGY